MFVCNYCICTMYIRFDEIHTLVEISTTVNDNGNIINNQKYRYIRAVYLISYIQRGNGTDTSFHRTISMWSSQNCQWPYAMPNKSHLAFFWSILALKFFVWLFGLARLLFGLFGRVWPWRLLFGHNVIFWLYDILFWPFLNEGAIQLP